MYEKREAIDTIELLKLFARHQGISVEQFHPRISSMVPVTDAPMPQSDDMAVVPATSSAAAVTINTDVRNAIDKLSPNI